MRLESRHSVTQQPWAPLAGWVSTLGEPWVGGPTSSPSATPLRALHPLTATLGGSLGGRRCSQPQPQPHPGPTCSLGRPQSQVRGWVRPLRGTAGGLTGLGPVGPASLFRVTSAGFVCHCTDETGAPETASPPAAPAASSSGRADPRGRTSLIGEILQTSRRARPRAPLMSSSPRRLSGGLHGGRTSEYRVTRSCS